VVFVVFVVVFSSSDIAVETVGNSPDSSGTPEGLKVLRGGVGTDSRPFLCDEALGLSLLFRN